MDIEYDPEKDRLNQVKHGISFARAVELELVAYVEDDRYAEPRVRLYGYIDELPYCAAGTERGTKLRIISLRRAHAKEFQRYVKA
jgi:uncharacterized DUF497 family protein